MLQKNVYFISMSLALTGCLNLNSNSPSVTSTQENRVPSAKLLWGAGIATLGLATAVAAKLKFHNPRRVKTQEEAESKKYSEYDKASEDLLKSFELAYAKRGLGPAEGNSNVDLPWLLTNPEQRDHFSVSTYLIKLYGTLFLESDEDRTKNLETKMSCIRKMCNINTIIKVTKKEEDYIKENLSAERSYMVYSDLIQTVNKDPLFVQKQREMVIAARNIRKRYEQRLTRLKLEKSPRLVDKIRVALSWW